MTWDEMNNEQLNSLRELVIHMPKKLNNSITIILITINYHCIMIMIMNLLSLFWFLIKSVFNMCIDYAL